MLVSNVSISQKRVPLQEVAIAWLRHHVVGMLRSEPLPPRAMHLLATGRCNAHCIMCGIWKEKGNDQGDLTLIDWDHIFSDSLFSTLEFAGISGGEPFLRHDLPDLLMLLHRHSPRLKRLSITSNGTMPDMMERALARIVPYGLENGLLLDVSVSIHGFGEVFERITGVSAAFEKAMRTLEILNAYREKGEATMSINTVLLRENLDQARELAVWAGRQEIPISFVVGEQRARFQNEVMTEAFITDADRQTLLAFLKEMSRDLSLRNNHKLRYRDLVRIMEKGARRTLPCYYALGGFVLGHDGELYYCSHSRSIGNCLDRSARVLYYDLANLDYRKRALFGHECTMCPPYTLTRWELEVHAHRVAWELLIERVRRSHS